MSSENFLIRLAMKRDGHSKYKCQTCSLDGQLGNDFHS